MIETERLVLRPTLQDDLQLYRVLFQDPDIVKYLPGGEPYSSDYIANYVTEKLAHWEKGFGTFTITLKAQPQVLIGYAGVEQLLDSLDHDVRYGLLPEYQGRGYAFEAAKAAIDFVLTNYLDEVFGVAVKANVPSLKILKKLGMEPSSEVLYDSDDLVTLSLKKPL
ncbi:GNAT family N-acetyltransferase [Vibrio variabilis]|uniref:GNAT family N-acetyltransferase n=1 Tax=Vibrio variabilis TaxID=990271 RepID=UPI000DDB7A93|nr:GNAT family N-acetyltransferase [Vibrio variabilis]